MMNTSRPGCGYGERLEHHAVHDAEDRGVRADAERQRQHRHRRIAGTLAQVAKRVDDVLSKVLEHGDSRPV